jgi:hypothetical protein
MIPCVLTPGNWIAIVAVAFTVLIALLSCWSTFKHWQGKIDTGIDHLGQQIKTLDEKFDKYVLRPLATSKSPLTLTEAGRKIIERPKVQEFIKNTFEQVMMHMNSSKFDSAYQAQEKLFSVMNDFKEGAYKINLENEAFETGQHIDILMKVIAIGIRDEVFARLNLKVEDIDNSEPKIEKAASS